MPRKSKLTRELIEQAAKLIEEGNYQSHVAQALGIHEDTWYRWMREGAQTKNGLKRRFYEAVKKAEARAIARNVALIQKAAQEGNWQAAAWWLERKFPDEWGKKDKLGLEGNGAIEIKVVKVSGNSRDQGDKEDL